MSARHEALARRDRQEAVTHIAIQEADANGKVVEWLEKVSDEQYLG